MYALLLQYNVFRFHSVLMGRPLKVVFDYLMIYITVKLNKNQSTWIRHKLCILLLFFSKKKKNPKNRIVLYGFL